MKKLLDTVLLLALPASGKSEVRRFMEHLTKKQCENDMHMGETLQLDDYPYVHFMHRIDDEFSKLGWHYIYKDVFATKKWNIPVARFDNREDLTTFIRKDPKEWGKEEYKKMYKGLSDAMKTLSELS